MPIQPINNGITLQFPQIAFNELDNNVFSKELQKKIINQTPAKPPTPSLAPAKHTVTTGASISTPVIQSVKSSQGSLVEIGIISSEAPTVSHLLKNNPDFSTDCWNILYSDINKAKSFNKMGPGVTVSVDTSTNEISWQNNQSKKIASPSSTSPESAYKTAEAMGKINADGEIIIGSISKETPTVSHLLKSNTIYNSDTWNIVFADINKDKPFSTLTSGTEVSINPQTFELSFQKGRKATSEGVQILSTTAQEPLSVAANDFFQNHRNFSERLADSVKSYIGKPYSEIDCYGLVVRGLTNQGVKYHGKGGLRENMESMAKVNGLPPNTYQNGEGLIKTAGHELYSKSFNRIENSHNEAKTVFNDILPVLQKGMILSFSTPTRGHTGIVSEKNGDWTYINSGLIDHQVDSGNISRRVGEEHLDAEIDNWFVLAKNRQEPLKITVGMLDENKLRSFNQIDENLRKLSNVRL